MRVNGVACLVEVRKIRRAIWSLASGVALLSSYDRKKDKFRAR